MDDQDSFQFDDQDDGKLRLKMKMGVQPDAPTVICMAERDWSLYDLKERVAQMTNDNDPEMDVDTEQVRLITQGRLLDPEEASLQSLGVQSKFTVIAVVSRQKKKKKSEPEPEPEPEPEAAPKVPEKKPEPPPPEEKNDEPWQAYREDTELHNATKTGDNKKAIQIIKDNIDKAVEYMRIQNQDGMTPLMYAAISGNSKVFNKIYDNMDQRSRQFQAANGMTALHYATKQGHASLVKKMLKDGHSGWTDLRDKKGRSALYYALKKKNEEVMNKLIKTMSEKGLSGQTFEGWSCLHVAVTRGLYKICKKLVDAMHPNHLKLQTQQGSTALHLAVSKNKLKIAEMLIEKMHEDFEALGIQNGKGSTALHLAVFKGRLKIIPKLLPAMRPEMIALRRADGNTALHMAARKGRTDVIKMFVKHMGHTCLASKTNDMSTPLHCAAQNGHNDTVQYIVKTMDPAVMSAQNVTGYTALSIASENDRMDTVKHLISACTKPDIMKIQTETGKTPIHFATQNGNLKLTVMLGKAMGPDSFSIQDVYGWNNLHNATAAGHTEIVEKILEMMPNTYLLMREKEGRTALHLACQYGHVDCVRLLLKAVKPQAFSLQSNNGSTVVHLAAHNGHDKVIGVLAEEMKPTIFALQDKYGLSACERAAQRGHENIAKLISSISGVESDRDYKNHLPQNAGDNGMWLTKKMGVELKSAAGWVSTDKVAKENSVVGLFFSTSSKFGDGEEFTPSLKQAFRQVKAAGKKMDIIFISSDKDESAFNSYFDQMPWKSISYADRALQIDLAMSFKLNGFRSALVLVDPKSGKVINKYGREALMRDPDGLYFPWNRERKEFWEIFQGPLIDGDNQKVQCKELRAPNTFLGIYFTDNESVQSREFTRGLTKFYLDARSTEKDYRFEVILAPCMDNEQAFKDTLNQVPWLSLPLGSQICEELKLMFEIYEEDRLVILNANTGELITANGRDGVELDPGRTKFPWPKQAVNFMTQDTFSAVSATPCCIILADSDDVDQSKFHKIFEVLHPIGEALAKKSPKGSRFMDLEFLVDNGDSGHTRFLRNIMNLKKKKDFVVIIDTFRMRVYQCPQIKKLKDIKKQAVQDFVEAFQKQTLDSTSLRI